MDTTQSDRPVLFVVVNNHFDLTWRRCWQRPFVDQGRTFVSYADLQEDYLLDNLALARQNPGYKFEAESTQVLRSFLQRHPELLTELRQLARAGRFAVTGGGEAIIDANMVQGESLVRNYVDGLLWVEEVLGQHTRLAVRNDAFGNSAQLPQILRGCEIAWATGFSYSPAQGLYWRGLDGSTILHARLPTVAAGGGNTKYAPCPNCAGAGHLVGGMVCPACQGRGIDCCEYAWLPPEVDEQALARFGAGMVWMSPEELLPNPALMDWAKQMRAEYEVRFALEEDVLPYLQPWLEALEKPDQEDLHGSVELNPNNAGVWVTRIQTKQTVRRQEYAIQALEALWAMAALKGARYPQDTLKRIRQDQFFTMFHDAITATHVDAAYAELQDFYRAIDEAVAVSRAGAVAELVQPQEDHISVINPSGYPVTAICTAVLDFSAESVRLSNGDGSPARVLAVRRLAENTLAVDFVAKAVPAWSAHVYQLEERDTPPAEVSPLPQPVLENERFRVTADEHGLRTVFDKRLEREILTAGEYRPAELILEHDEGSPWATLSDDQRRTPLSSFTQRITAEQGPGFQRLLFRVEVPREAGFSGKALRAVLSVILVEGLERLDFHLYANWDGFNHRLRVAMPVSFAGQHVYEIPYGQLTRQPYEPSFRWAGANGDWPAVNWGGVQGEQASVALLNRGTPSYRMEAGQEGGEVILLSLLRSPTLPTYLHEPDFYTMTAYDGMRDMGEHDFDFAVTAYNQPFAESSVVLDADAYHLNPVVTPGRAELPPMPEIQSGNARLAAVKWAEREDALILRLVEYRGQGGAVSIRLPEGLRQVEKVNLLERQPEALAVTDGLVRLDLRPWEIATLKLSR